MTRLKEALGETKHIFTHIYRNYPGVYIISVAVGILWFLILEYTKLNFVWGMVLFYITYISLANMYARLKDKKTYNNPKSS